MKEREDRSLSLQYVEESINSTINSDVGRCFHIFAGELLVSKRYGNLLEARSTLLRIQPLLGK